MRFLAFVIQNLIKFPLRASKCRSNPKEQALLASSMFSSAYASTILQLRLHHHYI
jgi:hypothetical protein